MLRKKIKITNKLGLHARAAAKFVSTASRYCSSLEVSKDDQTVNGKSIMGVMMLAAGKGSEILISAEGTDEEEALDSIESLINDRFGEDE